MMSVNWMALLLDGEDWYNSPFIVPVAGCALAGCITVAGIWSKVRAREMRSQERLAMIAQGLQPEPEWDTEVVKQMVAPAASTPRAPGMPNNGAGARRAGLVLSFIGLGLFAFFAFLAAVLRERDVLSGACAGILPLAIGIGFLIDGNLRHRDFDRWLATAPVLFAAAKEPIAPIYAAPPPPPPGMTPAQASDWRPLH